MCVLRDAALDGRRVDCVRRGRFAPRTTLRVLLLFPSRGKRVDRPLKRHPRRTVFDFEERKKEEGRHAIRKRVRCAEAKRREGREATAKPPTRARAGLRRMSVTIGVRGVGQSVRARCNCMKTKFCCAVVAQKVEFPLYRKMPKNATICGVSRQWFRPKPRDKTKRCKAIVLLKREKLLRGRY